MNSCFVEMIYRKLGSESRNNANELLLAKLFESGYASKDQPSLIAALSALDLRLDDIPSV